MEAVLGVIVLMMVLFAAAGTFLAVRTVRAVRSGVRRNVEQARRAVEDTALRARSYARPGALGEVAALRLSLRTAVTGTREALEAGAAGDSSVREALRLLDRLSGHAHSLDGELRALEREPHQDRALMTLLASVGLNDAACIAAITSLLPEIPAVLYATLGQKKLPTWVTDEWSDERWCRHVADSYAPAGWTWKARMWNWSSVGRQAVAYAVANAGGELRFRDVVEVLRQLKIASEAHVYTRSEFVGDKWSDKRPWLAPVIRRGRGPNGIVESKLCPRCGEPATLVLRVPEIPESLACVCGGVPGLNPAIVLPPRYRHLAISPKQLRAYAEYVADSEATDLA